MKLYHPLWTHSAAFAMLLFRSGVVLLGLSVPGEFPTHFGPGGPDRWGAAWELPLQGLIASIFVVVISIGIDGAFAQHGERSFNPFCLIDEFLVGHFTAMAIQDLARIQGRPEPGLWKTTLVVWAVAVPIAIVLERLRPPAAAEPETKPCTDSDNDERLAREVAASQKSGRRWMYWESQCPGWASWGMPVLGACFVALGAAEAHSGDRGHGAFLVLLGIAMAGSLGGGLRVSVGRGELTVRIGYFGWRVLQLTLSGIASVEVHSFNPLKDFGGWGLRWNREMRAVFLRGDRGVKITNHDNSRYLIGSDQPERLAAVIEAARPTSG